MKLIISIILILSFTIISVLGVQMVFSHKAGHSEMNCLASKILLSEDCLDAGNSLLFASLHVSALKNFTLANSLFTFQIFVFTAFIVSLLLSSPVYLVLKNLKIISVFYYNKKSRERFFVISQKEYRNWLSLYESRDRRPSIWVA